MQRVLLRENRDNIVLHKISQVTESDYCGSDLESRKWRYYAEPALPIISVRLLSKLRPPISESRRIEPIRSQLIPIRIDSEYQQNSMFGATIAWLDDGTFVTCEPRYTSYYQCQQDRTEPSCRGQSLEFILTF